MTYFIKNDATSELSDFISGKFYSGHTSPVFEIITKTFHFSTAKNWCKQIQFNLQNLRSHKLQDSHFCFLMSNLIIFLETPLSSLVTAEKLCCTVTICTTLQPTKNCKIRKSRGFSTSARQSPGTFSTTDPQSWASSAKGYFSELKSVKKWQPLAYIKQVLSSEYLPITFL